MKINSALHSPRFSLTAAALIFSFAGASSTTHATVILGNLPGTAATNQFVGYVPTRGQFVQSVIFTTNSSFQIDSAVLKLQDSGDIREASLEFHQDILGSRGTSVGSFSIRSVGDFGDQSFTPSSKITLAPGTYWLSLSARSGFFWWFGGKAATDTPTGIATLVKYKQSTDDGATFSDSTYPLFFQLNGTAVPEPSMLGLVGLGVLTLARRRR